MKKLSISLTLSILALFSLTGCLKDNDFESQKYGIQITEVKGVAFPASLNNPNGLGIVAQSTSQTLDGPQVTVEHTGAAAADIHIKVAVTSAAGFTALPAGAVTVAPLDVVIPAGKKFSDPIKLTFPNASLLNADSTYGITLTMTSVDQGYTIAENMKTVVYGISIKNPYDGTYDVTGFLFHPTAPRAIEEVKDIKTINAIRSQAELGDLGGAGYSFQFDVSPANKLVNWAAVGATPAAPGSGFMDADNPGGTDYSSAAPDEPGSGEWVSSKYNNTYDPATQTFWMHYGYRVGGTGQSNWTRQIYEKWVRQ